MSSITKPLDSDLKGVLVEATEEFKENLDPNIRFKEGSTIAQFLPYAWTILPKFVKEHCYRCGLNPHPAKPKRCSKCQYAHYCSSECQMEDWKDRHKIECKVLAHPQITTYKSESHREATILIFAAIARLVKELEGGNENSAFLKVPVKMDQARLHLMDPIKGFLHFQPLFLICDPKQTYIKQDSSGLDAFAFVFGAVTQNRRPLIGQMRDGSTGERRLMYPVGMELTVSPVNIVMGCISNSQFFPRLVDMVPQLMVLKATRDIGKDEPIMATRGYRFATPKSRAKTFATENNTICTCKACTDPVFQAEQYALKCTNVECTQPIPYDDRANQPCPACGTNNSKRMRKAREIIVEISKRLDEPQATLPKVGGGVESYLDLRAPAAVVREQILKATELLHPTNLLLGRACFDYCDFSKHPDGRSSEYITFLKQVIPSIEKHLDKYDVMTRQVYFDIIVAYTKRKEYKESLPYMDTLLERLEVICPKTNDRFKWAVSISDELRKAKPNESKLQALLKQFDYTSTKNTLVVG